MRNHILRTLVVLALAAIAGCASVSERLAQKIQYIIPQDQASPGDVLSLGVVLPQDIRNGSLRFIDRTYRLYPRRDLAPGTYTAFVPVAKVDPGAYPLTFTFRPREKKAAQVREEFQIQILPDFLPRPLQTVPGKKFNAEQYVVDRMRIQQMLAKSKFKAVKLQDLLLPLGGEIVSEFGMRREYAGKAEVALEGLEIIPVSATAVEVNAAADGLIRLAENLPMLGNTVLIDHGFSFATLYCHLKNLDVKAGQTVMRGDRLGSVGSTGGAAVGKRLYYQLFVAGMPVNVKAYTGIDVFK
ncbi:MAG: M23 family metallopeptidase [candidate division FCPU426 bacterium]